MKIALSICKTEYLLRVMFSSHYLLDAPVVRAARSDDAEAIASVLLDCGSDLFDSVFSEKSENAKKLLIKQYSKHFQGVHVLLEGGEIIAVMKLHLPGIKMGKTVSLISLIKHLGFVKGIRAMLLLSNWDEYKLSPNEAYIEYLHVKNEWHGYGASKILFEKAIEYGVKAGALYLTKFTGLRDYITIGHLERNGFVARRKIHSPIAKLYSTTSVWRKYTYNLTNSPLTVREKVVDKIQTMKNRWQQNKRESIAALRMSAIMTSIPVVGGTLAYVRGYQEAAIGWAILLGLNVSGIWLMVKGFSIGKYAISISMVAESINFVGRAIRTDVWLDRGWLLPIALMNLWIMYSLLHMPDEREMQRFEESSLVQMQEMISKAKFS